MNHYLKADRVIADLIEKGNKKFILFPFGEQGNLIKSILNNRYGVEEELIVDSKLAKISKNPKIISLADLKNVDMSEALVLLTSDNENIYSELRYQLMQYVALEKIVDVFSVSMYFDKKKRIMINHIANIRAFVHWKQQHVKYTRMALMVRLLNVVFIKVALQIT